MTCNDTVKCFVTPRNGLVTLCYTLPSVAYQRTFTTPLFRRGRYLGARGKLAIALVFERLW